MIEKHEFSRLWTVVNVNEAQWTITVYVNFTLKLISDLYLLENETFFPWTFSCWIDFHFLCRIYKLNISWGFKSSLSLVEPRKCPGVREYPTSHLHSILCHPLSLFHLLISLWSKWTTPKYHISFSMFKLIWLRLW